MKRIEIGTFEVVTGKVVVSDPCYEIGTWCQGVLENVREGAWRCHVLRSDDRVAELILGHSSGQAVSKRWNKESFDVGVDSGQAGVFDAAHYRDDAATQGVSRIAQEVICREEPWYSICCDRTLGNESGAGIIPFGVVSSSGYGDGSYRCYTRKDAAGCVVGIRIVFIADEDLEG